MFKDLCNWVMENPWKSAGIAAGGIAAGIGTAILVGGKKAAEISDEVADATNFRTIDD